MVASWCDVSLVLVILCIRARNVEGGPVLLEFFHMQLDDILDEKTKDTEEEPKS